MKSMKIEPGTVAVITGGGGGIGRCLAQALAQKGCNLALADINQDALNESQATLGSFGVKTTLHVADVTQFNEVEALAELVIAQHGKVNIMINNAGMTIQKSFMTHSMEDWQRMININLMGVIHGCKAFIPALKLAAKGDGAHLVNMSSMAGFLGMPGQASYSSLKSAVRMISETLYAELYRDNIGVTSVHPGAIKTKMILATLEESDNVSAAKKNYQMVQKMGNTPEYAAKRIVKAIEKRSLRIRIGKDAVILDILKRLLPVGLSKAMVRVASRAGFAESSDQPSKA